ncbi:threonine aldolase family protein [Ekhidna sp.]|uniref:threonine aldolase family protein n=1 Tax=Ekhidna sp. TaxID=2608089 RepID=UPI003B50472C
MKRREFIGTGSLAAALPLFTGLTLNAKNATPNFGSEEYGINLILDGYFFQPKQYLKKLSEIESKSGINGDFYSSGGVIAELEQDFCKITGKEKAIYMPSGTMANELALRILCGDKTKAIVHGDSHIYRDEGDSAQAIHNKRLVPINSGKHYFSRDDLENALKELSSGESFYNGVGALSMENPVRRHNGKIVDLDYIKGVTEYAKKFGIKTHLDGARIHLASAYSGITTLDYCSPFDTVYISLYKYLGACGGAILCGDAEVINQMTHLMKILGGTVFRSWTNASIAKHFLDGLEERMERMIMQSNELVSQLNELDEIEIKTVDEGTNVVFIKSNRLNLETFADVINDSHGIWMNYPENGEIEIHLNESILLKSNPQLLTIFKDSILKAK